MSAIAKWESKLTIQNEKAQEPAKPKNPNSQKEWDAIFLQGQYGKLLADADQVSRSRLLAAARPESGQWLHAFPTPALGTHLDAETFRIAIAHRVGADVCQPHRCRCGGQVDRLRLHPLSCQYSPGRAARHAAVNDIIYRGLQTAGLPSILEPVGLSRSDGRRPDGMTTFPLKNGLCLVWDFTCVDTYARSHLISSALTPGSAASAAEKAKRSKYGDIATRHIFEPIAVETTGTYGQSTRRFIKDLGQRITAATGDNRETTFLQQRIGIAIARGNALCVTLSGSRDHLTTCPAVASTRNCRSERPFWNDGKRASRAPTDKPLSHPSNLQAPGDATTTGDATDAKMKLNHVSERCKEEIQSGKHNMSPEVTLSPSSQPPPILSSSTRRVSVGRERLRVGTDELRDRCPTNLGNACSMNDEMQTSASSGGSDSSSSGRGEIQRRVRSASPAHCYITSNRSSTRQPAGATGLENIGNTCYMNAVLQVLAHTEVLRNYFVSDLFHEDLNRHPASRNGVAEEVAQVLATIWSGEFRSVSPHRLLAVVSARRDDFGGMRMHDAHEFMIFLLGWLHDDLNVVAAAALSPPSPQPPPEDQSDSESAENAWRLFQRANDSIEARLFHGLQKSALHCTSCGYESATFETFSLLSLPLAAGAAGDIYSCLEQYVRGDLVSDWCCPQCSRVQDTCKKLDLWRLPQVVILHLKRFGFANGTTRKAYGQVSFPLRDLDLGQLVIGRHPDFHGLTYDLYGVIQHHGSHRSGHYTAFCYNKPAERWFLADDSTVKETTTDRVKDASAYILCYAVKSGVIVSSLCVCVCFV